MPSPSQPSAWAAWGSYPVTRSILKAIGSLALRHGRSPAFAWLGDPQRLGSTLLGRGRQAGCNLAELVFLMVMGFSFQNKNGEIFGDNHHSIFVQSLVMVLVFHEVATDSDGMSAKNFSKHEISAWNSVHGDRLKTPNLGFISRF